MLGLDRAWDWVREWHSTPAERAQPLPCDDFLAEPKLVLHRAVDVDAPPAAVFRWLCQLRVAPYSYDLIDNFGRRSPRHLIPGMDELEVGMRVMTIFRLVAFERDRHFTILTRTGRTAVTYLVTPRGDAGSRLLVRVLMRGRSAPVMPILDLPMMRRELLNMKELAEGTAREAEAAAPNS